METKITLPFLLIFFTSVCVSQNRRPIQGTVSVGDASPSNILILNLNTEQEVKSNSDGTFKVLGKQDDILVFSSETLNYLRIAIGASEYDLQKMSIVMTSKLIVLDEVEINNNSFDALDLGILQQPAVRYTVMERRLKTAGDFKPIHLLGLLGGSLQLDPIFNAINGKTKRLKKEIKLERNEKRLKDFQAFYLTDELIEAVKINAAEVVEFTYFVLDEEEFKALLAERNKNKLTFYLIQKYSQFNDRKISNEND